MQVLNDWRFLGIASLLLGLAPFYPEPHLFGKIKWVLGGATGMQALDWFDLLWHGLPFILLLRLVFIKIFLHKKA